MIPHTGPARLFTRVVRTESDFIEGVGEIPAMHPAVAGNRAPAFLGIELGAQAAAALGRRPLRPPVDAVEGIGHLARIREATFFQPDLPVCTPLRVTARLQGSAPPLAMYEISIYADGVECVRATISCMGQVL